MSPHVPAPFHMFRAAALATGILTLAAGAHVAGGGRLPAPGILLAILALTALASTAATRLRLALPALTALLGGGQLALHELFTTLSVPVPAAASAAASASAAAAAGTHATHNGHFHGGSPPTPLDLAPLAEHLAPVNPEAAPLMLAAHAAATLGCALLLARGEAALWALAAWLRPLVALPRPVTADADAPVPAAFPPAAVARPPWRNLRWDSRRGPPAAVVLPS